MARVNLTDKKLKEEVYTVLGFVGSLASIIALGITLPNWWKLLTIVFLFVPILLVYTLYKKANSKKSANFKINNINIKIYEGDIFETRKDELNVIPFNEYFDVIVDNKIIAENSLHGMYIKRFWPNKVDELNSLIKSDDTLSKYKTEFDNKRVRGNKQKYEIGAVVCIDNFVLTALSKFDNNDKAHLSYSDYIEFLFSFWEHVDEVYANRTINIPIFGSGITRIRDKKQNTQQLLETIIWSISQTKFNPKNINIIIYKDSMSDIDFYHLEPKIY